MVLPGPGGRMRLPSVRVSRAPKLWPHSWRTLISERLPTRRAVRAVGLDRILASEEVEGDGDLTVRQRSRHQDAGEGGIETKGKGLLSLSLHHDQRIPETHPCLEHEFLRVGGHRQLTAMRIGD